MNKRKLFEYCFGVLPDALTRKVIVTPFLPAEAFKGTCLDVKDFGGRIYSGFTAEKYGERFAVIRCGLGARLMGDAVLFLSSGPVENVIFAGSCGALKGSGIGDILIGRSAFNGEGFTRYHMKDVALDDILGTGETFSSHPDISRRLEDFAIKKFKGRLDIRQSDIFTIGSLMAETKDNLARLRERGFDAVDLELSAVYAAAQKSGIKASSLLAVSDLPMDDVFAVNAPREAKKKYRDSIREIAVGAVDFITGECSL